MPVDVMVDREKKAGEMLQTLKTHILRQREKLKQEQEQDAAMERHRREQEMKRKRNALSLEEINEQLVKLEAKAKALKEEKEQFLRQFKKVCSEDEERKRQNSNRGTDLLHPALVMPAQNQIMPSHPFTAFPYPPAGSLIAPVRPPDAHIRSAPAASAASAIPLSHGMVRLSNSATNGSVSSVHNKTAKRKHDGYGSPGPSPRSQPQPQQTSSYSVANSSHVISNLAHKTPVTPQSVPRSTSSGPGYPLYFGAQVPTTIAYDSKGKQCYIAVPVSENAHREMYEQHFQQQIRGMNAMTSSAGQNVIPIQMTSSKSGGISSGFPVQRTAVSMPSMPPPTRDIKSDPHRPYPPYF